MLSKTRNQFARWSIYVSNIHIYICMSIVFEIRLSHKHHQYDKNPNSNKDGLYNDRVPGILPNFFFKLSLSAEKAYICVPFCKGLFPPLYIISLRMLWTTTLPSWLKKMIVSYFSLECKSNVIYTGPFPSFMTMLSAPTIGNVPVIFTFMFMPWIYFCQMTRTRREVITMTSLFVQQYVQANIKETSKLRITGHWWGKCTYGFISVRAGNAPWRYECQPIITGMEW